MLKTTFEILLLWMCCELCIAIKVPVVWSSDSDSDVNSNNEDDFSVQQFQPQNVNHASTPNPVPTEYFQYTAKKPQFAIDVAKFHGVQEPEKHYSSYPIRPYTGVQRPDLGKHHIYDKRNQVYEQLQNYKDQEHTQGKVSPHESSYEVFHPYEREVQALQSIYKDPVLDKIRHDLKHTKDRLQNYEKNAGESNISKDEYLENLEVTDRKKFPHRNVPSEFEIHRPMRRPAYYRPTHFSAIHNMKLNKKFRHPLNQNFVKIKPMHYRPLLGHLQSLRQHHAHKYDDKHNEYPQVIPTQNFAEPPEGYDIYEKGKANFEKLRDNVDESVNRAVKESRPVQYEKLELQNSENNRSEDDDMSEEEFVPVKSYAQVRKTETARHLPRSAALREAKNFEELQNAPRLRKAVKSTKAQTVYSEEGYEDSAYDHAGEQKHASDHEDHGGYLVEKELSGGKYKTPSVSATYEDAGGSIQGDNTLHGEKWKNKDKDHDKESEAEDYLNDDVEEIINAEVYQDSDSDNHDKDTDDNREKGDDDETNSEHDVNKREAKFRVPEINLNDTYLTEKQILKISEEKKMPLIQNDLKEKYPYYFKDLVKINKHSPLRYAENLKFIPRKSKGGTEFYDSRSKILECPEVDDEVDPIPDKIKYNETAQTKNTEDDDESKEANLSPNRKKRQADFDEMKKLPRLKGLGDKIDCFKAKYFGNNPLDSPFFKEDLISNPEPIDLPNFPSYKYNKDSYIKNKLNILHKQHNNNLRLSPMAAEIYKNNNVQKSFSTDSREKFPNKYMSISKDINVRTNKNITNDAFQNEKEVSQSVPTVRRKRSFTYEPYKIIRDSQVQESKKATIQANINPLLKQLKTHKIVEKVTSKINDVKEQPVKRDAPPRFYIDINRSNRSKNKDNLNGSEKNPDFVDVNIDSRRGEPRYEMKNHKLRYSPVENRRAITVEDYEANIKSKENKIINFVKNPIKVPQNRLRSRKKSTSRSQQTTRVPVSFSRLDSQTPSASNINIQKVATTAGSNKNGKQKQKVDSNEDNDEDYDDADEKLISTLNMRPKKKPTDDAQENVSPKLRLRTRFHLVPSKGDEEEKLIEKNVKIVLPKFKEKSKKSSKSTIVTDSNTYGDGEDDMRKDEIDAMIGVTRNMDDYIPKYEKEFERKNDDKIESSEENSESDEDKSDESYEISDESTEDESDENVKLQNNDQSDDKNNKSNEKDQIKEKTQAATENITTAIPLIRKRLTTTIAPTTATKVRSFIKMRRPIILKKKIEIHKELPYDKKSPHITQFREDIKEIELVKKYPDQKSQDDLKILDNLNRNLAKDVNKLGDVEVFQKSLEIGNGPKHGGNYKSARIVKHNEKNMNDDKNSGHKEQQRKRNDKVKQHKNRKPVHGSNYMTYEDSIERNDNKNEELINQDQNQQANRQNTRQKPLRKANNHITFRKNQELIEFIDSEVEQKRRQPMHGGNYMRYEDSNEQNDDKNEKSLINESQEKSEKIHQRPLQNIQPISKNNEESTELLQSDNQETPDQPTQVVNYMTYEDSIGQNDDKNEELIITYDKILPQANEKKNRQNSLKNRNNRITNKQLAELLHSKIRQNSDQPMHGGNYMTYEDSIAQNVFHEKKYENDEDDVDEKSNASVNEKAVEKDNDNQDDVNNLRVKSEKSKDSRNSAAELLNFLQVAPILTTTPNYILDPGKRRYYFVDP